MDYYTMFGNTLLTPSKRMIVADREYVTSKYNLGKLKDLENLVADAGRCPLVWTFQLVPKS